MGGSVTGYPPCHRLYSSAKSSDCSYGRWQLNVVDVTCRWCLHDMTLFASPEASTFRQERGMNAQDVQFGACVGGIWSCEICWTKDTVAATYSICILTTSYYCHKLYFTLGRDVDIKSHGKWRMHSCIAVCPRIPGRHPRFRPPLRKRRRHRSLLALAALHRYHRALGAQTLAGEFH